MTFSHLFFQDKPKITCYNRLANVACARICRNTAVHKGIPKCMPNKRKMRQTAITCLVMRFNSSPKVITQVRILPIGATLIAKRFWILTDDLNNRFFIILRDDCHNRTALRATHVFGERSKSNISSALPLLGYRNRAKTRQSFASAVLSKIAQG